jgi:hypothetical protein
MLPRKAQEGTHRLQRGSNKDMDVADGRSFRNSSKAEVRQKTCSNPRLRPTRFCRGTAGAKMRTPHSAWVAINKPRC